MLGFDLGGWEGREKEMWAGGETQGTLSGTYTSAMGSIFQINPSVLHPVYFPGDTVRKNPQNK